MKKPFGAKFCSAQIFHTSITTRRDWVEGTNRLCSYRKHKIYEWKWSILVQSFKIITFFPSQCKPHKACHIWQQRIKNKMHLKTHEISNIWLLKWYTNVAKQRFFLFTDFFEHILETLLYSLEKGTWNVAYIFWESRNSGSPYTD